MTQAPRPGVPRAAATPSWVEPTALALLGAILLAAPFLAPRLWLLHYGALVPWTVLLTREHGRRTWLYFLLGAYGFFVMASGPFSIFHKAVPFVIGVFCAPVLLPFAVLLRRLALRYRLPCTLLVPLAWTATEWLRFRLSIGRVTYWPLGASQAVHTALIQVVAITGVHGVGFILAMASGALADLLGARARRSWQAARPAAAFPIILVGVLAYGSARLGNAGAPAPTGPRVAIIQPNVTHYRDPARAFATFADQVEFTRAAVTVGTADLIVLPENAIGVPFEDDLRYQTALAGLAAEKGAAVVTGAFSWASREPPRVHTSAYYFAPQGALTGRYDKLHLIPWAEYVPFESWLPSLSPALARANRAMTLSLMGYASAGAPGSALSVFALPPGRGAFRFATPICFEVSDPGYGRSAVQAGADFLVNITSEGYLGPPVYYQMVAHSVLRAVENRVPVLRAGNSGISGFIDPYGRANLLRGRRTGRPYLEEGVMVGGIPLDARGAGTFYTRHGDVLAYLCVGASLLLFVASFRRRSSESSAVASDRRP